MARLTDTQLIFLSTAVARDDGIAIVPQNMNRAAVAKVGASLVSRKLMREVRTKPGMPIWREDADNRPISLMITRAGRNAVGADDKASGNTGRSKIKSSDATKVGSLERTSADASVSKKPDERAGAPRSGTKQALVIDMLNAKKGATLDALIDATGWLPHTTRAALTGLRKRGFQIERHRGDGEASSTYRIVGEA